MNAATTPPDEIAQSNLSIIKPRGIQMRPQSQTSQISISPLTKTSVCPNHRSLMATVILVSGLLFAPTALAGVENIEDQGRRTQTGPKGPQVAVDGMLLVEPETSPTESGRLVNERGRMLRARPTQPVSVGLLGCPGCTWVLEAIGGVFVDVEEKKRFGRGPN